MKVLLILCFTLVTVANCYTTFKLHRVVRDVPRAAPLGLSESNKFANNRQDLEVAPSNVYGHQPGRVGPVYTFVKTDPEANFKWGVRHVAGVQYGRK